MLDESQLKELSSGIGASECGVILGIDPYKTPYELWLEKTGRKEKEDISQKDAIVMGNMLEPVIAKRYAQLTNQRVARVNQAYRHKSHPYILCHLDRKIIGKKKAVEIKTANPFSPAWGEEGSDEVPLHYVAQVQHQMAVTGWEEADLIVFRGTTDLRIYPFKRDEELIKNIIDKINYFWVHNICLDIAPPPKTRGDLNLMHPKNNGEYVGLNEDIGNALEAYMVAKELFVYQEKFKKFCEQKIIGIIGDNDGIIDGDQIIATYKANKNGTRILRISQRRKL